MAVESSSSSASSSSTLPLGEPLSEEEGKASFSDRDVRVVREGAWSEEGEGEEGDVVMCVVWAAGKLGACYYCVASGVLHVMPDVAESVDFAVLGRRKPRTLTNLFQPLPTRTYTPFISHLQITQEEE